MANIYNVGTKVDLRINKHEQTSNGIQDNYRTYKSKILDILENGQLKLAMPIEGGSVVLLPMEQSFEIFFYTLNGLYESRGKVVNRLKENNIFMLELELTAPVIKNQRREYFRYDCTIDIKFCPISEYETTLVIQEEIEDARGKRLEWKRGIIVDISGGGMRFTANEQLTKNAHVLCKFILTLNNIVKEYCTIIKIISSEKMENRERMYESRAKYISMSPEETEQVVHYIFQEQRKAQKNRKS